MFLPTTKKTLLITHLYPWVWLWVWIWVLTEGLYSTKSIGFNALNSFVHAHAAVLDVSTDKLRDWRPQDNKVSTLD